MINGLSEGSYSRWHRNGQKAEEATLKNGRRAGKSTNWDENGNITSVEHY
jgi:antitoxin component YwqK of YwqJK toxin-antitoxin module